MVIKGKTEELLVQQLNTCERPNLRIMGIEEGEEVQEKVQETFRTPNTPDQNRTTPQHIIIKTKGTETREKIKKSSMISRNYKNM
jgi:hypothetical protein